MANIKSAKKRQKTVLKALYNNGIITKNELDTVDWLGADIEIVKKLKEIL